VYVKVFCNKFADRFVGGAINRRSFDFDFETPVRQWCDAFAFATRVYLDVYFHAVRRLGEGDAVVLNDGCLEFFLLIVFHGGE